MLDINTIVQLIAIIVFGSTGLYLIATGHQQLKDQQKCFVDRRQHECLIDFIDRRQG